MFHHDSKNIKKKLNYGSKIPPILFIPADMWKLEIKLAKGIREIGNDDIKKFLLEIIQKAKEYAEYFDLITILRKLRETYSNKMSQDTRERLDQIDKLLPDPNRMYEEKLGSNMSNKP